MRKGYNIFFLMLTLGGLIFSCVNKDGDKQKSRAASIAQKTTLTLNEDKGIKEILEYYGGQCKYSIGAVTSSKTSERVFFEIELRASPVLEKYQDIIQMPMSNIAYLFYKNLDSAERFKYNDIRATVILSSGEEKKNSYDSRELEIVLKKINFVNKIVELLKQKQIQSINAFIKTNEPNKAEIINRITQSELSQQPVKTFIPYGFSFYTTIDSNNKALHVSGVIIRDSGNSEFSIDIGLERDEIYNLEYKL